ncbi:MAG TPA: hypothetical protein VK760_09110 [Candidatus Acidoferrales bacterium]|jgi:hypothetical protein|nr:hypothetical protein [Candidatus Acidoferrales bacterium]
MPADRAARLGITILGCAVLVIGLAVAGIFVLLKYVPATPGVTHLSLAAGSPAGANAVVRRRFERAFMASALLDLPQVPPQRDEPSLQISFFQRGALIQGGVIRTPANKFRLAGFLAYEQAGGTQTQVRYYGNLPEGPHVVTLSGDEKQIVFTIDGKVLDRVPRATFLPDLGSNDPWLMLGTAVGAPGNGAYGRISHIRIRNEYDKAWNIEPNCIVTTGGITMVRSGDTLRLGGRYRPGVPARYRNCSASDLPG